MIYIVKINIGYRTALFEFDSVSDAGEFIKIAVTHNVKGEDSVTILMVAKRPEENDEESEEEME